MNNHTNTHYRNINTGEDPWAGTVRKAVHHAQMTISLLHRARAFASTDDIDQLDVILDAFSRIEAATRHLPSMRKVEHKPLTPSY